MSYCTQTDILLQIPEAIIARLTDDSASLSPSIDSDKVTRAIADADALIDSYCESSYTVPFETVPDLIRKISVDLSIYNLYSRKESIPAERKERHTTALTLLDEVATLARHVKDSIMPIKYKLTEEDLIFTRGKESDDSVGEGSLDDW